MADHARSENPEVQRQLDRLAALSPGRDILGLERIGLLLERLGNPEQALPPVFHVAGTNGKGSTCAFLRAALEAAGYKVHVYTSPHLVRFNERIRLAGQLIDDEALAAYLGRVLDIADGIEPSFFEVTTAAAFLAFAEVRADACVIEVGLGGRLDATNVLPAPAVTGICQLGMDHQAFLGDKPEMIAAEKAGIAKASINLVTQRYPPKMADAVAEVAEQAGAPVIARGTSWDSAPYRGRLHYRDLEGRLDLPAPRLAGAHQAQNAGLAIAMLRHQQALAVPEAAMRAAMGWAEWPARMQPLVAGPLRDLLPRGSELWLDGGHNPAAARVVADHLRAAVPAGKPLHLVMGLLANKDAQGVLRAFAGRHATLHAVPVPDHEHHAPADLAAQAKHVGLTAMPAAGVAEALGWIGRHADRTEPPYVLILGSLYLAGEVLRENEQLPD
ncbi:bifunctional folylpolyglutamate synthase/dihydrofolate synthase [Sphingomonas oryzagri]|uniref:Dihydrofolate synthase/folylpolyglutamate synthase n=1 Tax=Sphingomonas oryzagri TaxID=3042314 RepID=A0ABT6MY26_9SPHN|nr:folylpolyglutamate synthase/dihydrofolate synthase family protein [Sphingomonas oryzagri]MDH7637964.1 folylpolyglutamate synthase/dihydrofolate synthase family protein [Sphingomonas oryzagri]